MKLITFEDINNLKLSPKLCYQWVSEMIANKENALLPPKISIKPIPGTFCNVMPCMLESKTAGVKIVTRYPEREPSLDSLLLLMNKENGEFLSIMDANWITAMRTGAVAVHSLKLFAKKQYQTISIIGLGNTARAFLLVLANVETEKELHIRLYRYKNQEVLFAERFKEYKNIHFEYVDEYKTLIKGADVVVSCVTCFDQDICEDDWFDEGVLLIPVHTRGFSNCDLFFDKVFADDYGHVCHFKNFDHFKKFAEVSDVVTGKKEGRTSECERILAYNIGVAMHDMYFASHIYDLLKHNESLYNIDLKSPKDKFWI